MNQTTPYINFKGQALSLEELSQKAELVEEVHKNSVLRTTATKNKANRLLVASLIFLLLCYSAHHTFGGLSYLFFGSVAFIGYSFYFYIKSTQNPPVISEEGFGCDEIFGGWLARATKKEMLMPANSVFDLKYFKSVAEHPAGEPFVNYIISALSQRDLTVFEEHQLKFAFEELKKDYELKSQAQEAVALREELIKRAKVSYS